MGSIGGLNIHDFQEMEKAKIGQNQDFLQTYFIKRTICISGDILVVYFSLFQILFVCLRLKTGTLNDISKYFQDA